MAEPTIKSTVGVQMAPEGMISAAQSIDRAIQKNINGLNSAAKAAKDAISNSKTAADAATSQMSAQLKALSMQMAQLNTLSKTLQSTGAGGVRAAGLLGDFSATGQLGKRARALTEYRQSLEGTASAVTVLRNRVAQFDQAAGNLAQQGKLLSNGQILKAEKLQETARAYSKITNEVGNLRSRISLLSEDGQKTFRPMLKNLEELEKANAKAFSNRSRSNFGPELTSTREQVRAIREQLGVREKLEASTRLNIQSLRTEGAEIIRNTQLQREALLANQVRAGRTQLRNMAMTGGAINQRDVDLTSRFARVSALAATTQNQLTAALNQPNSSAERVKTLIDRYKELQRQLGLTIAQQEQANKAGGGKEGGFFGGLKASTGNLLGGEGGFGAGALVGRVGAYALAAGAIYGMIAATKEAITFTIQFEDQLAQLQAISGSTSTEMERLSSGILEVSKNSSRSVAELTNAATIIAQAGYAGSEIGLLLDNVTKLADASGSTADQSVDILTSALGAFQLEASESTRVTDGLVAALNDSKLAVNQVQLGLQYLGAIAKENNLTFEELTAVMGAAADAGIRSGSTAATGTRQLLIDLMDPSKKLIAELTKIGLTTADIDVKTLGLVEVLNRLREAGFQAYGTIETRAAAMYGVLANNTDQIERLVDAQTQQGVAEMAQETRLTSLSAKWQIMLNTFAELAATIGKNVTPVLKVFVELLTIVGSLILGVTAALTEVLTGFGLFTQETDIAKFSVEGMIEALRSQGHTLEEARELTAQYAGSTDDLVTSIKDSTAELDSLETKQRSLQAETQKLIIRQEELAGKNGDLNETTAQVSHQVNILSSRFPELRGEFEKTKGGVAGLIQSFIQLDLQTRKTMANISAAIASKNQLLADEQAGKMRDIRNNFEGRARATGGRGSSATALLPGEQEFIAEVKRGDLRKALNRLGTNPELRRAYSDTAGEIAEAVTTYDSARMASSNAKAMSDEYKFSTTKEGQGILNTMNRQSAEAQRASSQGTAGGKSKPTILSELAAERKNLLALQEQYGAGSSASSLIGQALASNNAATSSLSPPVSDGGSGGGGKGRPSKGSFNRTNRDYERNEAAIAREEVEYKKELYENQLRALENAPTLDDLPKVLEDVDDGLTSYLNSNAELSIKEIKKTSPNKGQRDRMMEASGRKAEQLRMESIEKISDVLSKAIKKFIDDSSKAIELQYKEATRFTQRNLDLANARLQGLSNPVGSNNRPEYMKTLAQKDVDIAADRAGRAQIPANDRRIEQYEALRIKAMETQKDLELKLDRLGKKQEEVAGTTEEIVVIAAYEQVRANLKDVNQEMIDLETKTLDLKDANESLRASYEVLNTAPTTFTQGFQMALDAVTYDINAASSLGQELINNLDQPIRAIHEGFKGFFSDILSGTVSIGDAFQRMAGRIIDAILEMVAVALANQFFQLIASSFGGSVGGFQDSANSGLGQIYWNGGSIGSGLRPNSQPKKTAPLGNCLPDYGNWWRGGNIPGYIGGGNIRQGMATRDSVLIKAAKGEHIIRNAAVESVGKDFLDSVNSRGAEALREIAPNVIAMPGAQSHQETNVYVIAPDEKPQLGPNDVIAIISQDVLKGGATKKLIKKVANG